MKRGGKSVPLRDRLERARLRHCPGAAVISLATRLLDTNSRWSTAGVRWGLTLSLFAAALAGGLWHTHIRHSLTAPPPLGGDAVAYDSLAWELAQGRGFQINYDDAEFQRPYREAAADAAPLTFPDGGPPGPTTTRPPLVPFVMAGLNRVFGRQFWGIRATNIAAMSAAAALAVWTVCRLCGPMPALLAAFNFLIVDWRTRAYAREVLTESLACLAISLFALALHRAAARKSLRSLLACGALFGAAILIRTMFVLWLPVLLGYLLGWDGFRSSAWRSKAALGRGAVFLSAALIVPLPWFVRNVTLLDRCMPLGTQGTIELSAAYSDEGFRRLGMWFNQQESGAFHDVIDADMTSVEAEIALADAARSRARNWMASNPHKLLLLPPLRLLQEFRPHGPGELYVLAFAILGLLLLRGRPEGRTLLTLLIAAALGIALTWSTAGRFLVPILFVLHVAAAVGLWVCLMAVTLRRDDLQSIALPPVSAEASETQTQNGPAGAGASDRAAEPVCETD